VSNTAKITSSYVIEGQNILELLEKKSKIIKLILISNRLKGKEPDINIQFITGDCNHKIKIHYEIDTR
jgi:hypothetical protein